MDPTGSRYQIDSRKIVIFGAGRIGRSFIGQLFGAGGYKVVFIEIDPLLASRLNTKGKYKVVTKGKKEEVIVVRNVKAIYAFNTKEAAEAVSSAGILAVSVGKNSVESTIPVIAAGLVLRYMQNPDSPLDIIIAENMISAADFMKERLIKNLPPGYPFEKLVGLIDTSIGKMVPIMTRAELEKDPLMVYAEPYNTLILDGKAFKSIVPDIKGLDPKDNIKAWIDCKAFIHNLGHATAAYYGYYLHPEAVYIHEVLDYDEVYMFTGEVMLQSAEILKGTYPDEFTGSELEDHISDLISRFRNRSLRDTIFRVGHDLTRKLNTNDRFMGAIHLAGIHNKPYDKILKSMAYGLCFRANDEDGNQFHSDIAFLHELEKEFEPALINYLGFDPVSDRAVIEYLKKMYHAIQ